MDKPSYLNFNYKDYAWKQDIDYRLHPELYRVGRGEQGVLICEPYKSEIGQFWRFKNVEIAKESSDKIISLFKQYLIQGDFVGADMALNTFHGLRRARKEGRYMGMAPYGYDNKITEEGKKYIAPVLNEAKIVRWIFEEIAKEIFNTESVYHMAKDRGLTCTKGNFWMMIKNPLYCGKIVVPKYKDEDAQLVDGQHEAIISEGLFYRVQDVLAGRSRNYRPKVQTTENFPLRGFFICPKCDRKLTGSKCKGRHKHYYYYHCEASCKYRINSEKANEIFIEHLNGYRPIPEVKKLYSAVLLEAYKEQTGNAASEKKKMLAQIREYEK